MAIEKFNGLSSIDVSALLWLLKPVKIAINNILHSMKNIPSQWISHITSNQKEIVSIIVLSDPIKKYFISIIVLYDPIKYVFQWNIFLSHNKKISFNNSKPFQPNIKLFQSKKTHPTRGMTLFNEGNDHWVCNMHAFNNGGENENNRSDWLKTARFPILTHSCVEKNIRPSIAELRRERSDTVKIP